MILVIFLFVAFFSLSFSFYKKRKQEDERILALAREKRRARIEFFCQRAREMPDKKIGEFQIWWARNHEPDKALKKYYV